MDRVLVVRGGSRGIGAAVIKSGVSEPVTVLEVDPTRVTDRVRVENLEGGTELFPHILGALPVEAVVATVPASVSGDGFVVGWLPARCSTLTASHRPRAPQRSVTASLPPSATKLPANVRRIHVTTRGRETTCRRTWAARTP